ncbi:hypothetical protein C0995_008029 [Termitomyces sp. Mi166|nr:hypothetical protein C0995_008029 [Termitomyces sp. Mi166\
MHILAFTGSTLIALLGVANCLWTLAISQANSFLAPSDTFINSTGLTDKVGWDPYSFYIHGQRIFLQSGEFHTWRLPVPALWKDITQKAKAAGFNALSIYVHWHLLNPKKGVVDLTGINELQPLFDAAKEAGLFIIARPGPYINAETTTGGLPGHVTTVPGDPFWNPYNGEMRSNDTFYHDAWQDYWNAVIPVIAKNQITNGGPVIMVQIENEYYNGPGQNEYVAQLRQRALDLGIVSACNSRLAFNSPTESQEVPTMVNDPGQFQNLVDSADIYGIDAYPVSGSYDPWGSKGGYAACRELTNPNFQRVYYFALWANGVTAVNFYMFYGGTSWAQLPYTNAYTSYDYGAAVAENRELSAKFGELKLQSLFLRTFKDIYKTDYKVGSANKTIPQLGGNSTLLGRDSFIISTDLVFGSSKLLYSTAMLLSTFQLDGNDALIVYGNIGLVYEVSFQLEEEPTIITSGVTQVTTKYFDNEKSLVVNLIVFQGITTIELGTSHKTIVLLVADYSTATNLWMPTIAGNGDLAEYIDVEASAPLLVRGPYLVRTAALSHNVLALTGDLNTEEASTVVTVYGPSTISSISWNGKTLGRINKVARGTWEVEIGTSGASVEIPDLMEAEWRYKDSLPEIGAGFEDESLVIADHTTTTNTFPPYYGGPWILYADDYGFHAGNLLWRGTFQHNDSLPLPTAVNISVSGGIHFAASAWLNEHFLGSSDTLLATNNESWPVTEDMLMDGENHVTVLQEGIISWADPRMHFIKWKLAGNYGGEDFPDKTRKILNEGGLYAERKGWHLPGFDDSGWELRTPFQGLDKPGVGFFRTTFNLDLPMNHDIPLSIVFDDLPGHYRAQLYINGWQMGKRVANIGPQVSFVVQQGILNYEGENVIGVSLWGLGEDEDDLRIPSLTIVRGGGVYEGGVGDVGVEWWEGAGWEELRG